MMVKHKDTLQELKANIAPFLLRERAIKVMVRVKYFRAVHRIAYYYIPPQFNEMFLDALDIVINKLENEQKAK